MMLEKKGDNPVMYRWVDIENHNKTSEWFDDLVLALKWIRENDWELRNLPQNFPVSTSTSEKKFRNK